MSKYPFALGLAIYFEDVVVIMNRGGSLIGQGSNFIIGDGSFFLGRTARVAFCYKAEQDDELTLEVGDVIENIVDTDVGWCDGELNGKRGMFPNNFVEEIVVESSDNKTDSGEKLSRLLHVGIFS